MAPADDPKTAAIYYCNRAAAQLMLSEWKFVLEDCNEAVDRNPEYVKAYQRRAKAFEALEKYSEALEDHKQILELDPTDRESKKKSHELGPKVAAQQEKMKDEMMGKLKDMGNTLLGKFGMSLDNFKSVQDPATGAYSISFQQ